MKYILILFYWNISPTGYDFSEVLRWFGERVDRIILLFDAHKLDISDEFSEAIKAFRGQDDKIRVVLNKADQVDTQQLMRVYGALMWSLGKVINTPEVVRVYLGSFWAKPLQNADNRRLFEAETQDLFRDIQSLPRNAALRKLNDLIKRARLAKVRVLTSHRSSPLRIIKCIKWCILCLSLILLYGHICIILLFYINRPILSF